MSDIRSKFYVYRDLNQSQIAQVLKEDTRLELGIEADPVAERVEFYGKNPAQIAKDTLSARVVLEFQEGTQDVDSEPHD